MYIFLFDRQGLLPLKITACFVVQHKMTDISDMADRSDYRCHLIHFFQYRYNRCGHRGVPIAHKPEHISSGLVIFIVQVYTKHHILADILLELSICRYGCC